MAGDRSLPAQGVHWRRAVAAQGASGRPARRDTAYLGSPADCHDHAVRWRGAHRALYTRPRMDRVRELLKEPSLVDAFGGDLAKQAQLTLINKFSGHNLLFKESLTRKLDLLREEL